MALRYYLYRDSKAINEVRLIYIIICVTRVKGDVVKSGLESSDAE